MVQDPSVVPNQYTFVFVLKACGTRVYEGEQVCAHAIKHGLDGNLFVRNVVIKMYADMGMIGSARKVFDGSCSRDLYSWNSMINGYVGSGDMYEARELFDVMPGKDVVSWSTMVAGYVQVKFAFILCINFIDLASQMGIVLDSLGELLYGGYRAFP